MQTVVKLYTCTKIFT